MNLGNSSRIRGSRVLTHSLLITVWTLDGDLQGVGFSGSITRFLKAGIIRQVVVIYTAIEERLLVLA